MIRGPGSSVGIAIDYRLDGPGSNPSGDELSARPASYKVGIGSFLGIKCGRGRAANHPPTSSAAFMEE